MTIYHIKIAKMWNFASIFKDFMEFVWLNAQISVSLHHRNKMNKQNESFQSSFDGKMNNKTNE